MTDDQEKALERIREIAKTHGLGGLAILGNNAGDVRGLYLFEAEWIKLFANRATVTPKILADREGCAIGMSGVFQTSEVFCNGAVFTLLSQVAATMAKNIGSLMDDLEAMLRKRIRDEDCADEDAGENSLDVRRDLN